MERFSVSLYVFTDKIVWKIHLRPALVQQNFHYKVTRFHFALIKVIQQPAELIY